MTSLIRRMPGTREYEMVNKFLDMVIEPDPNGKVHIKTLVDAYQVYYQLEPKAPRVGHRAMSVFMYWKGYEKKKIKGKVYFVGCRIKPELLRKEEPK